MLAHASRAIGRCTFPFVAGAVVLLVDFAGQASADPPVSGLIGLKHKALGGDTGPLGRPTSVEMNAVAGKGRYQIFQHGSIGVTPSTGAKSVQPAYIKGNDLVFDWSDTSPFNYNFFLVRWDLNRKNIGQQAVRSPSRTSGRWSIRVGQGGHYRVIMEGGDKKLGGSRFRQGWSNPLDIDYRPPAPDYFRYVPRVKEPISAGRRVRQYMPNGLYRKEWMRLGGSDGPMGLPVSAVRPHPGGGKAGMCIFRMARSVFPVRPRSA